MTRQLSPINLIFVISYLLLIFIAGIWLTRPTGRSVDDFLSAVAICHGG